MLFLAQLLDRPVFGKADEPIGKLDDLIVRIAEGPYPPITGLVVRDRRRRFFVPGSQLAQLNGVARLTSSTVDLQPFSRRNGEVLLGKDVLDHQIIDITGRRVVRVNDIQLAQIDSFYRVLGVDLSPQALLRRLGPRWMADQIIGRQVIDWAEVQYLASAAPVQLRVSYDRLAALPPVDLARIVDTLSYPASAEIVAALDDSTAAEALEEVSDARLADLLEGMNPARAADILEEMNPNAAVDALEDLDDDTVAELLSHMETEEAADVQALLAYDEASAGRIMTTDIVCISGDATVDETLAQLRALEEPPDPLLAVYAVAPDDPERLLGIVRLSSLILAPGSTPLNLLVEEAMPTISPDDSARDAARVLAEYNLLTVPVLDDSQRLIGIVTVEDALEVLQPEIWQRRRERLFR